MKLVVTFLAVAVFASLICPASFERREVWDGNCPTERICMTRDYTPEIPLKNKNCKCFEWGCVIDKVYYYGTGCEGEDMVCKDGAYKDVGDVEKEKLRDGKCNPFDPNPTTTTTTTTTTTPKPTTEKAFTTTTSGTVETKYGAWKLAGMTLIGCFVFFFGGQIW